MSLFDLSWVTLAPVLLEIKDNGTCTMPSQNVIKTESAAKENNNMNCSSNSSGNESLSLKQTEKEDFTITWLGPKILDLELKFDSLDQSQTTQTFCKQPKQTQVKGDPLSFAPSHIDKKFFDYPFFVDRNTYRFLKRPDSRVMFIMRGLSGSGKSTIVDIIQSAFIKQVAVCSADSYFYTTDGEYNFDEKLLSSAHGDCQHKAKQACQNKVPIIVIDNTNVKKWEMKFYVNLANISGYVVILVEPKTPWKWNAKELAARNKHGVTVEIIQRKVSMFEDVIPAYYGWFLNEKKSKCLIHFCSKLFLECIAKFPGLKRDLLKELRINPEQIDEETAEGILLEYYTQQGKSPILHCTAKFCAWGRVHGAKDYHKREAVQKVCGQVFDLTIAGIVVTKKTLSARVSLDTTGCDLFDKPEEREWGSPLAKSAFGTSSKFNGRNVGQAAEDRNDSSNSRSKKRGKRKLTKSEKREKKTMDLSLDNSNFSDDFDQCEGRDASPDDSINQFARENFEVPQPRPESESVKEAPDTACSNFTDYEREKDVKNVHDNDGSVSLRDLFPSLKVSGFARSAHFTIKTVRGVESKEVNFDILEACDLENKTVHRASDFVPVSRGQACYYGQGLCCVYFDQPLTVKTLFSGYY